MGLILLLQVDHVGPRENTIKLAYKLSDAPIVFFQFEEFSTILGHIRAHCFHLGLYISAFKL